MTEEQAIYNYCLRMGDNSLIQSYRLSEWCSNAPILEEDLALTNFALDMIGRAQAMLAYAGKIEGKGRTDDDLAYRRSERQYYNHLIMELPNGDFAKTIARLLFTATYEFYLFTDLQRSADPTIAAIAAKTVKEVKYHMAHAGDWVLRLGDGTEESHNRIQKAINKLWMYTGELFETDETDAILADKNIAVDLALVKAKWTAHITGVLKEATLSVPEDEYMQTGGRKGVHTEHLGHILSEMQYLQRAYPEAIW
ncbi:MAG: Phenylacetate-CoA oxygenase subunit PaaI [Flavipsychrobacter sp.]|nr:Phenylacetate-CoA oxygenase subunit PaaI [Flavipsychrobacter sp.]